MTGHIRETLKSSTIFREKVLIFLPKKYRLSAKQWHLRFKTCLMSCTCQDCQSIYITSHNSLVFITLTEMRFKWEVSSVWFTGECWEWPTGSLWSNQVLNLESLPSGSTTALPSFLKPSTVPFLMVKRRNHGFTSGRPFPSLLCHQAHCGGGGQRSLLLGCFPCTEGKSSLDPLRVLPSPLLRPSSPRTYLRAAQHSSQSSAGTPCVLLAGNTLIKYCSMEAWCFLFLLKCQLFSLAISHHSNYIPRATEISD